MLCKRCYIYIVPAPGKRQ